MDNLKKKRFLILCLRIPYCIYLLFFKDYFYVTRPVFEKMIDEGGFFEHAEFSGNRYGTRL